MASDHFIRAGKDAVASQACTAAEMIVTNVKSGETGRVQLDEYVPYAFESPTGTAGTGTVAIEDGHAALFEIGIDLATGRLHYATLVSFANKAKNMSERSLSNLAEIKGLPVLSTNGFNAGVSLPRIVVARPLSLWRNKTETIVQFGFGCPSSVLLCGEALFLLAGQALWGCGVRRSAPAEVQPITV